MFFSLWRKLGAIVLVATGVVLAVLAWSTAGTAQPMGHGGGGMMHGGGGMMHGGGSDMAVIHQLFSDPNIRRTVREIPGGVETVTETDTPGGAERIQRHVAAMHERILNERPIHARDPLFAAIFEHADAITMVIETTQKGVKVRETSTDPYVTKLIRAHAAVVTKFIKDGMREMHVNHPAPAP